MLKRFFLGLIFVLFFSILSYSQQRSEIKIPDIPGYYTLKCDFHMHTIFSDGDVWPTVRVQEAWLEGLDAISITDHIEYRPHSQDIDADHNRAFEIAKPLADQLGIILIRGTEITRKMPPGHLNAIFIKNANLIEREGWREACTEAKEQGAFVFWNHPGWKTQQPDSTIWWKEHTRLYQDGILRGIEVFNTNSFYPEALKWAKEKELTVIANSDIHAPASMVFKDGKKRPVTLVFANERTGEGIRQALVDRRTVAYFNNKLVGDRDYLTPLFFNSLDIMNTPLELKNHEIKRLLIKNESEIPFMLKKRQPSIGFTCPDAITLEANKTILLEIEGASEELSNVGVLKMYYEVENLNTLSGEPLPIVFEVSNK